MDEKLFRKKSIDKMKSPDRLDDFIRVTNPGIWLLFICVSLLLIGAFVWGTFGRIDSVIPSSVRVENGSAVCCVAGEDADRVAAEMTVRFEGNEAKTALPCTKEADGCVCPLDGTVSLPDGVYRGDVVVKSYRPISFILN